MTTEFEFTCRNEAFEGLKLPDEIRGRIWERIMLLTKDYQGRRPSNVDRMTDEVAAFFGGPTTGQSTWARECWEAVVELFGNNLMEGNESLLQGLKRNCLGSAPKWLVSAVEYLLQGWAKDRDEDFNSILHEGNVPVKFEGGKARQAG